MNWSFVIFLYIQIEHNLKLLFLGINKSVVGNKIPVLINVLLYKYNYIPTIMALQITNIEEWPWISPNMRVLGENRKYKFLKYFNYNRKRTKSK